MGQESVFSHKNIVNINLEISGQRDLDAALTQPRYCIEEQQLVDPMFRDPGPDQNFRDSVRASGVFENGNLFPVVIRRKSARVKIRFVAPDDWTVGGFIGLSRITRLSRIIGF